jgi:hypothetical protein
MRLAGLLPTTPSDELLRPTREREEDSFSFRPQQTDAIHRTAGEQRTQQGRRRMTCREAKAVVLFHKRCKSLYDFPTVDARCGSLHEVELAIALERGPTATRESGPRLACQRYQSAGSVFWHQSGKSGAIVAGPQRNTRPKPAHRALTSACLGAVEGNKHFVILRSAADLDGEGNLPHHREIAGRVALRHGGGDAHLVGRKRLLI